MQRQVFTWTTRRLNEPAHMVRWGHFGTPVLLLPSAGGDCEEIERFGLIGALGELIGQGRIKIYSIDGLPVRTWLGNASPQECVRFEKRHDAFLCREVVPRICADCQVDSIAPVIAGVSLGAFTAVAEICRHPEVFRAAIGVSGVYDLARHLRAASSEKIRAFSAAALLRLGSKLEPLRRRMIVLASGEGPHETPAESRTLAAALEAQRIPSRLSLWGPAHDHVWASWRAMLPQLLSEQL
ncbi:MAG TPA: alpha/beta hydrolase-fold protein [Steroidobacteraceae bacterium]|nr:alpha/beta hydrolase-fold protein [Steroidobacteraceae bacterium]